MAQHKRSVALLGFFYCKNMAYTSTPGAQIIPIGHASNRSIFGINIPDVGLTERASDFFGQGRTSQGGSSFSNPAQTTLVPSGISNGQTQFAPLGQSGAYGVTSNFDTVNGAVAPPVKTNNTTTNNNNSIITPPPTGNGGNTGDTGGGNKQDLGIFDQIVSPLIQTLESQVAPAQQYANEAITNFQSQGQTALGKNQTNLQSGLNQLGQRQTAAENTTQSAINDARRQFSELSQGLSSKYGQVTGVGSFAEAILGGQTQRNIAGFQNQLYQSVQQIQDAKFQVQRVAEDTAREIQDATNARITQARKDLNDTINNIRSKVGEIQSTKAQWTVDAIKAYQKNVFDANQLQQNFLNKLAEQKYASDLSLRNAEASVANKLKLTLLTDNLQGGKIGVFNNNNTTLGGYAPFTGGQIPMGQTILPTDIRKEEQQVQQPQGTDFSTLYNQKYGNE